MGEVVAETLFKAMGGSTKLVQGLRELQDKYLTWIVVLRRARNDMVVSVSHENNIQ